MNTTPKNDPKKEKKEQQTPIIDGDARPDINLNPEAKKDENTIAGTKDKEKFTKNRADTNSLEDFRDAK